MFTKNYEPLKKKSQNLTPSNFVTEFNWVYTHLHTLKCFSTKEKFNAFCKFVTTRNCFKAHADLHLLLKQQISAGSFSKPPSTLNIHLLIDLLTKPNSFPQHLITFLNQNIALIQNSQNNSELSNSSRNNSAISKTNNLSKPKSNNPKISSSNSTYCSSIKLTSEEKNIYDRMNRKSHPIFKWDAIQTSFYYYNSDTFKGNSRTALDLYIKKQNIELNKVTLNAMPIVHYVISVSDNESLKLLIQHNVCLTLKSNKNETPIEFILNFKTQNTNLTKLKECLMTLISHDKTFESKDDQKRACAIWATIHGFSDLINLLIRKKTNLNVIDSNGNSLITLAIKYSHHGVLKLLITAGIDINNANHFGETPAFIATWTGNYLGLSYLVENGANINKSDKTGQSPIHVALHNNNESILHLLFEYGADINIVDKYGNLALNNTSRSASNALLFAKISSADLILPKTLIDSDTPEHINLTEFKTLMIRRHCAVIAHRLLSNIALTDIQKQLLKTLCKTDKQLIIKIAQNYLIANKAGLTISEIQHHISL
jgi:ankyrin repeat protein